MNNAYITALTIGVGLLMTLVGWLHMRHNSLEKRMDNYVEKDSLSELKETMRSMNKVLQDMRVENAKWQVLVEKVIDSSSKKS